MDRILKKLVDDISKESVCRKIILISSKTNTRGYLTGVKLAVITDRAVNTAELECELYLKIDCEITYDLIIYKGDEWDSLIDDIGSFAWKISKGGVVLYEQGE